ncbi:unnamed protein product [Angiostrongylus costaricensis]|uniref:Kunitz/Bovine pancreatic trypsin inhibitor domain protein n=1 Tax=Angiostrongylus costaricensis TaxID=334426 RepID=A0A158PIH2_ANGCS|nr:unnamed protein product [Angiostrongylus costaricensis]
MKRDVGYSCDAPKRMLFYYDARTGACQPMLYRGCGGNENKFDSAAECNEICGKKKARNESDLFTEKHGLVGESFDPDIVQPFFNIHLVDECNIPTDADVLDVAKTCEDGCPMNYRCNENNKCCPTKDYICSLPVTSGSEITIFKHYGRYAHQHHLRNCIRFSYFGSGGNFNNFRTYNDCKRFCMDS